jgi:hypothetical protein
MSRRALGVVALATGLIAVGALPFLSSANAADCPAWTDPAGDGVPFQLPAAPASQAAVDIVSATATTVGTDAVVKVKVGALADLPTGAGDRFTVQMDVSGAKLRFYADRQVDGSKAAGVKNSAGGTSGTGTATWDLATDTVAIKVSQAELDKAAGKPTKGLEAGALSAGASAQTQGEELYAYDVAVAPAAARFVVGAACSSAPAPTGSPTASASPSATASPTASPSATASPTATATPTATASPTVSPTASPTTGPGLPEGYPKAGCNTFTDAKGDGGIDGPPEGPNDPDLDLVGVALNTTPTDFEAFLRVDDLKALPANGNGHWFDVSFTHDNKVITLYAKQFDSVYGGSGLAGTPTGGKVGGTDNATLKVTSQFDVTNNVVILKLTRASLDAVITKAVPDGTKVTAVQATSRIVIPTGGGLFADKITPAAAEAVYTFGNSPCFGPPPTVLTNTGATTAQYTDAAAVAAKAVSDTGAALSGKTVTFTLGGKSVTATTGSDGFATAALPHGLTAGSYSLVTSFAGDATAAAASVTTPFTVTQEKTRIVLKVVKSGTKRTVTAQLLDDDGKPVAGQVVTWYVNGKKVSAPKTSSTGTVTLTTAKPTQTVKAVFTAVTGKYLGSTAQTKV